MSITFKRYDICLNDIDDIFKQTNKSVGLYLLNQGLPITFDFSDKFNKTIYTHYFLNNICEYIRTTTCPTKMVFYNNTMSKDIFRNSLIKKVKRIFGIKIWNGVFEYKEFYQRLKDKDISFIDDFEVFIQSETKPKTFKHIKKYLEKEGFKALSDTYFKDITNKMTVCS